MICSFCKKTDQEVKVLVVTRGAAICDKCIALCEEMVAKRKREWALDDLYAMAFKELWQGA